MLSVVFQRLILEFLGFLRNIVVQKFIGFVHLIGTISMGFYASALTHCGLFYGEIIRLASENPVYSFKRSNVQFCLEQSRLLMIYLLLILNIPSVIVWTKSLRSNELVPFFRIMPDCGFNVAITSVVLHQIRFFKNHFNIKVFNVSSDFLGFCVLINSFVTVLYATVSLYRVQYFILVHLFLMTFNSVKRSMDGTVPQEGRSQGSTSSSVSDVHFQKQFKNAKKND